MKVLVKRKTGFMGMGSAIKLVKNHTDITKINFQEEKELTYDEGDELIAQFSFLKSDPYVLTEKDNEKELTVSSNPTVLNLYMSFFTLIFILPIVFRSWLLGVLIVICYVVFIFVMAKKYYLIKRTKNGE